MFKWHPISESVRLSLIAAGEHLRLARTAIEAGEWYPSAHFTTLRGALVGASQALWIVAPSSPQERQERGLMVIGEMYDQMAKHLRENLDSATEPQDVEALKDRQAWCATRQSEVLARRQTRAKLNQTEFISWSLSHRFPDERRRTAGRLLWRELSSDAHVLGWSMYGRAIFAPSDARTGLSVGQAGGSIEHIAQSFVCAHLLLREGWSFYDRRCEE